MGGASPAWRAPQHLQWLDLASRGPLPPASAQWIPQIPRLENQTQGLGPHLLDVGTGWYRVLDATDGEDDVRQGVNGATVDNGLFKKEGERRLAQLILLCVESPKVPCVMTPYLAIAGGLGVDDLQDLGNKVIWANQQ